METYRSSSIFFALLVLIITYARPDARIAVAHPVAVTSAPETLTEEDAAVSIFLCDDKITNKYLL